MFLQTFHAYSDIVNLNKNDRFVICSAITFFNFLVNLRDMVTYC